MDVVELRTKNLVIQWHRGNFAVDFETKHQENGENKKRYSHRVWWRLVGTRSVASLGARPLQLV
jgi:hypothetical protein